MTLTQADIPEQDTECDFCSAPLCEEEEVWAWPCGTFVVIEINWRAWGDWDLCGRCHRLLLRCDYRLLFQRIVKMFSEAGDTNRKAEVQARLSIKVFKTYRLVGPPQRVVGQRKSKI